MKTGPDVLMIISHRARHLPSPDHVLHCDTGTYDYSPPEIFTHEGHGTKLDIWAVGCVPFTPIPGPLQTLNSFSPPSSVITHVILSGMMPFPNTTLAILRTAILRGDVSFEGRYWQHVSDSAKSFVRALLHTEQKSRPTASDALAHPWITTHTDTSVLRKTGEGMASAYDLPGLRENISSVARARWRAAFTGALNMSRSKVNINGIETRVGLGASRRTAECDYSDDDSDGESLFDNTSRLNLPEELNPIERRQRRRPRSLGNIRHFAGMEDPNAPENLGELRKLVSAGLHRPESQHYSTMPRNFKPYESPLPRKSNDTPSSSAHVKLVSPLCKHSKTLSDDMDSDDSGFTHSPTGSHFGSYRSRSTATTSVGCGSDNEEDANINCSSPINSSSRKTSLRVPGKLRREKSVDLRILV